MRVLVQTTNSPVKVSTSAGTSYTNKGFSPTKIEKIKKVKAHIKELTTKINMQKEALDKLLTVKAKKLKADILKTTTALKTAKASLTKLTAGPRTK